MARELTSKLKSGLTLRGYYPEVAKAVFNSREALREYNRLRRLANARLAALARRYPTSSIAREYKAGFPAAGKEDSRRIYLRLYQVAKFMQLKLASVTGMREYRRKSIETLHERGYDFVNESNFDAFTDYMEEVKTHEAYSDYPSEEVVELFREAEEKNADPQEIARGFERYLNEEGYRNELEIEGKPAKPAAKPRKGRKQPAPLGSPVGRRGRAQDRRRGRTQDRRRGRTQDRRRGRR